MKTMSQKETNDLRNASPEKMAELMRDLLELGDSPDSDPSYSSHDASSIDDEAAPASQVDQ
jgi:hypothetical protein